MITRKELSLVAALFLATACIVPAASTKTYSPIRLHPENPHYFLWRDKPTILITSGEHYGAVLNRDFDYGKYLSTIEESGFNLTRTFSGAYCEPAGAFNIKDNTLAPLAGRLICPWARSGATGYAGGGAKFDLAKWDTDYFARLRDFLTQASRRGIVVELVLFCPFYEDAMWNLSPMNSATNVNGVGSIARTEVYTLNHPSLLAVQDAMVKKIVTELADFDNLYYEICNEPYFGGVTLEWQRHIAATITQTEASLGVRHLIAQNIANKTQKITDPDPNVSIFNFHYAKPPTAVTDNYRLNKAIGDDETGFAGTAPKPYRLEAWDFIIAGGAVFSNLDYSFNVGHEDGSAQIDAPGSGGTDLRRQLAILSDFINGFDFIDTRPDNSIITSPLPDKTTANVLLKEARRYAVYINGNGLSSLSLRIPTGTYTVDWLNTRTGRIDKHEKLTHSGGDMKLTAPEYADDIALKIIRAD